MKVARTSTELTDALLGPRASGTIGFVPTMGALHEGHLSLVDHARARCDAVVLSIFVNPLQFGPGEDLDNYPRDEARDLQLAESAGVDVVFLPDPSEIYPEGSQTSVRVGRLAEIVEGADRPGHFDGVATVVTKLFNLVQPQVAIFGQKDAQQVAVIRALVRDLLFPVRLVVAPTVRDGDGLALSSRNAYLSADERRRAAGIYRALRIGEKQVLDGDLEGAEKAMWESLIADGFHPSYARCVDPDTFEQPVAGGPALLVIAARMGGTRLIDNLLVQRSGASVMGG